MELFLKADTYVAIIMLCFLEVVLGIDNIVFISIVSNKLPEELRQRARNIGLSLALLTRIGFLFGITWIIGFREPLFIVPKNFLMSDGIIFSGRDLILGLGGLFLIGKSVHEIHQRTDIHDGIKYRVRKSGITLAATIMQIILLDIVFSFDSILTAVGTSDNVIVMVAAICISIGMMMLFSEQISRFIHGHPSIEMLALGFLILIGFMLFLESLHYVIQKGFIYFALTFSLLIELINIRIRKRKERRSSTATKSIDQNLELKYYE